MGFGGGERILINDRKTDGTAQFPINLPRNSGVSEIEI